MKHLVTIIILTLTLNSFGQHYQFDKRKISKHAGVIVGKIEKVNQVMSSAVYYEGMRPAQYDNFTELQKQATEDELLELVNHPVSYTHLRAHETPEHLVCRLLLEKKKK